MQRAQVVVGPGPDVTFVQLWRHVRRGEINEARELLESGEEPDELAGCNMLMHALDNKSFEMARLLMHYGVDVNSTDHRGQPLLHQVTWFIFGLPSNDPRIQAESSARQEKSRAQVEMLVQLGANVSIKDKGGWTVLHKAAYHGHVEVVRWLLEHVERMVLHNDIVVDVFAETNSGETAQQLAKLNAHHRATPGPHHQIVALLEYVSLQPKSLAFAMGLHPRLGAGSVVTDFKPELLRMVLELVLDRVQ